MSENNKTRNYALWIVVLAAIALYDSVSLISRGMNWQNIAIVTQFALLVVIVLVSLTARQKKDEKSRESIFAAVLLLFVIAVFVKRLPGWLN